MRSPLRAALLTLALAATAAFGHEPPNGPRRIDPAWHALVGATVHVAPGEILDGECTVQEMGQRIFEVMLRTASGERSKSELLGLGDNEFVPWQIGIMS